MSFANVSELASWLDETIGPGDETTRAQLLLDAATGAIQAETGQDIEQTVDDTITLDGTNTTTLVLPQHPVTAVGSVSLDGTVLTVDDDYKWTEQGILYRTTGWGDGAQNIEVTYTHGYATIPDAVKNVCLQAAARAWNNPSGIAQESVGSYSVTNAKAVGVMLTEDERRVVGRFA